MRLQRDPTARRNRRVFRTSGQFHLDLGEAEIAINVHGQLDERGGFGLHLLFGAEDVGIVLSKRTYTHDAVQRT